MCYCSNEFKKRINFIHPKSSACYDFSYAQRAFGLYAFLARLYESTGRAIAVTPASASASALALASASASASALLKMLKFLVKVFMSLYLLKLLMDQVDTLHVGRYWSEVLCCTIMTHLGDLEVKVTDLEIFC